MTTRSTRPAGLAALSLAAIAALLVLAGCDSEEDAGPRPQLSAETGECAGVAPPPDGRDYGNAASLSSLVSIEVDSQFPPSERNLIHNTLERIRTYGARAEPGSYFQKAFGGTGDSAVLRFVDERINYLLPPSTDPRSRMIVADETLEAVAFNLGTLLWWASVLEHPRRILFRINDRSVRIDSSRVGIVQTAAFFAARKRGCGDYRLPMVARAATLVHEARHSDCTGGLAETDVLALRDDQPPPNRACGHTHVACPPGHDLEGSVSCDSSPWGAYAIEALYAIALVRSCASCTELDRQVAKIIALDSADRVTIWNALAQGAYGDPDMSSQGVRAR
jgi:hypothetical protein